MEVAGPLGTPLGVAQREKNAQRDPGEKGWICYYCRKEGHLKWDCAGGSDDKRICLACRDTWVLSLGWEDPLEKGRFALPIGTWDFSWGAPAGKGLILE